LWLLQCIDQHAFAGFINSLPNALRGQRRPHSACTQSTFIPFRYSCRPLGNVFLHLVCVHFRLKKPGIGARYGCALFFTFLVNL
jgi:hypothetical protein